MEFGFGFFLKKTISYFVEPFGMVIALLFIGFYFLFRKKEGLSKTFLTLGFSIMLLYSYPPFTNYLITNLENKHPKFDYKTTVKYIHVLGNGHNTDPSQPLSSQLASASIKRNIEGIIIHLNMKDSKIIFTGFAGHTGMTTAQMNTNFAMALGVKKENIIMNGVPRDTKEEALFTKTIVKDEPFVLVTSANHMPRAMMLFESLGMHPIPAPTDFHKSKSTSYFSLPSLGAFTTSQFAVHEYIGIMWSKLKLVLNFS